MAAEKEKDTAGLPHAKSQRGRPRKRGPTKMPVTIRLDIDLVDELKASGQGWQTRLNNAVREWVFSGSSDDGEDE